MVYDVDYREVAGAAVDTAYTMTAKGADTPGAFVVPTTANRITELRLKLGGISATDVVMGMTWGVHLYGSGIELSEGWFAGNAFSTSGAAATSGGQQSDKGMIYKTNIPVRPGGLFNADAFFWGEDTGTAQACLVVVYDGVPGKIRDGDVREVDIGAAANTLVTLANRGAAVAEGDFRPGYTRIVEIVCGAAPDPLGDAAAGLNFGPTFQLSGPGLLHAGNYSFAGNWGMMQPDTDVAGDQTAFHELDRYECDIAVKRGDSIRAQAQNIESVQAGHAVIGFLYG